MVIPDLWDDEESPKSISLSLWEILPVFISFQSPFHYAPTRHRGSRSLRSLEDDKEGGACYRDLPADGFGAAGKKGVPFPNPISNLIYSIYE